MEIKLSVQGMLIYATMTAFLLGFALWVVGAVVRNQKLRVAAMGIYAVGAAIAILSFGYRAYEVQRVPFRDMFEVMLFVGAVMYPLTIFCRRVLLIGAEAGDMFIGAIALFPSGFVFDATPSELMPALQSQLFTPHVAAYLLAYAIMAKAGIQAVLELTLDSNCQEGLIDFERGCYRLVLIGFPLLTLGLILGAWWGKIAWGDWWNWDPKEMWSLASWVMLLVYLHFRMVFGRRFSHINSVLVLLSVAVIIMTLFWVNFSSLFSGLHSYA